MHPPTLFLSGNALSSLGLLAEINKYLLFVQMQHLEAVCL